MAAEHDLHALRPADRADAFLDRAGRVLRGDLSVPARGPLEASGRRTDGWG